VKALQVTSLPAVEFQLTLDPAASHALSTAVSGKALRESVANLASPGYGTTSKGSSSAVLPGAVKLAAIYNGPKGAWTYFTSDSPVNTDPKRRRLGYAVGVARFLGTVDLSSVQAGGSLPTPRLATQSSSSILFVVTSTSTTEISRITASLQSAPPSTITTIFNATVTAVLGGPVSLALDAQSIKVTAVQSSSYVYTAPSDLGGASAYTPVSLGSILGFVFGVVALSGLVIFLAKRKMDKMENAKVAAEMNDAREWQHLEVSSVLAGLIQSVEDIVEDELAREAEKRRKYQEVLAKHTRRLKLRYLFLFIYGSEKLKQFHRHLNEKEPLSEVIHRVLHENLRLPSGVDFSTPQSMLLPGAVDATPAPLSPTTLKPTLSMSVSGASSKASSSSIKLKIPFQLTTPSPLAPPNANESGVSQSWNGERELEILSSSDALNVLHSPPLSPSRTRLPVAGLGRGNLPVFSSSPYSPALGIGANSLDTALERLQAGKKRAARAASIFKI